MTDTSLRRVTDILAEVGSQRVFTARRTASVEDLDLEVQGVGELRFPIPSTQARQIRRVARPAHYGKGEETLLDPEVRDTWQVPKSRVKIDKRRWNRTLLPMLDALRADLGLPDSCRLKAQLHSLLLYGPGQFFAPHQDSEKADEMIGTLVVMLPTTFKGGSLVIEHLGETVTYRGSADRLTFAAFYADCRHEVRPVRSGFRMVLTYNLILAGEGQAAEGSPGDLEPATIEALSHRLREHFATPLPPPRFTLEKNPAPRQPPNRLVYLLDHQYTQRGLGWHRLKGNDLACAGALRLAAQRADCDLVLALAEVHETWSCFEPGWSDSWGRRHRYWNRDEDDDWVEDDPVVEVDDPDAYELQDLVDSVITLDRWIDPSGGEGEPLLPSVDNEELCARTPSSALQPYASEYEGYMGNYGNTMDRWYRRAAVVVWPRERSFAVHAEASPTWAVDKMLHGVRGGRLAEAREMVSALSPFWGPAAVADKSDSLLGEALLVADGLDEPDLAASLLQPFRLEDLSADAAATVVALVERYGDDWTRSLLSHWSGSGSRRIRGRRSDELRWIAMLPALCRALRSIDESAGGRMGRILLQDRWAYLQKEVVKTQRLQPPSRSKRALEDLPLAILGVIAGTKIAEAVEVRDDVMSCLCGEDNEPLLPLLVQTLRAAEVAGGEMDDPEMLPSLRRHAIERLRARLERPQREADDWSMTLPDGCRCELCTQLEAFLTDPGRRRFEWPVNKERRQHIHRRIDAHELPVRHQTRREGRPYTLVLEKTRALFEAEARNRRSWSSDLEWLVEAEASSQAD